MTFASTAALAGVPNRPLPQKLASFRQMRLQGIQAENPGRVSPPVRRNFLDSNGLYWLT